ncbi:MAG: hypothetical protein HKN23_08485 [Verrucomicrobiales bacterium]|nr:hypothetical protein [Verrucomicrobiales bacterium]
MKKSGFRIQNLFAALTIGMLGMAPSFSADLNVILVVGAEGAEEFGEKFRKAAEQWQEACEKGEAECVTIGLEKVDPEKPDRDKLIEAIAGRKESELWVVLIGHGTFDGRQTKFNLRGPDFSDEEIAEWLKDFPKPLAVMNTTSASAPFLKTLSGENRVVMTATKSPNEIFYARFGEYLAEAVGGLEAADLDNDDQVSLLESFLYAANQVAEFYEKEGRLATEHALIDDNGDGLGTRPDWFEGVRATRIAAKGAEPDGERALQRVLVPNEEEKRLPVAKREKRDALELEVKALVRKKSEMEEEDYYRTLETLLREISKIYQSVEKESGS